MDTKNLSLREKYFIFKYIFKLELNIILLNDNELRCMLKAIKYCIWFSIIYLILNIITVSIGYY